MNLLFFVASSRCAIRMVDKERARTKLSVTSCSVAGMKAQKETREEKCEENNREAGGSGKPVENWSRCAA